MRKLTQALQLSLGLACLSLSTVCLLHSLGVVPDAANIRLEGRKSLCETVAIFSSAAAARDDRGQLEGALRALVERNRDILSASIRLAAGGELVHVGELDPEPQPAAHPPPDSAALLSTPDRARVPLYRDGKRWGVVEVRFRPLKPTGRFALLADPSLRFIGLLCGALFASQFAYLAVVFRRGRPVAADIPERVRATLDTLVEGVLLMDMDHRIALVNQSFARTVGKAVPDLEGQVAEELKWTDPKGKTTPAELPWTSAVSRGEPALGALIGLRGEGEVCRTLSVNSTPIVADDGVCRGVLATFDDMTYIERRNIQLTRLLDKLRRSQAEIRAQNAKLVDLATLDPLTGCLNRRAFFERFDVAWKHAERHGQALSCIMLDIDHFKSVNDRYGHAVGDQAIQAVSGIVRSMVRASDLVCRYGGEEFCVLMPQTESEEAAAAAERFRETIAATVFAGISVTSSFGVASAAMGAKDPHELVNRADEALYGAKHSGRNRVVRYDAMPADARADKKEKEKPKEKAAEPPHEPENPLPYHAVASLISALAHRDPSTAEHSRRVANLCVAAARGVLSEREGYVLEIAALLHDIGKLGIPDAILKKPAALTPAEWEVMKAHDDIGVEIIAAAFASDDLREIVRTHHAWYGGNPRSPELPVGEAIPLGARLLAIADSYDAMISDRVYRKARARDEAFAELRRCAGFQFDPNLVERFIEAVAARDDLREAAATTVSKREALRIGLLIERLVDALDARNPAALIPLSARLRAAAAECRAADIVAVCDRLDHAIASRHDWVNVLEIAGELLDLCRATQATYLSTCTQADFPPPDPSAPAMDMSLSA